MLADTNQSLALIKAALGNPQKADEELLKAITQATGLVQYDLQAPALSLIPVLTPLRNTIPRVQGQGGTATNWKAVTAINATNISVGVSEGNRGAVISTTVAAYVATYAGLGLEDNVSFEADYAAQGFQDVKATSALNLLRSLMIGEEGVIIGGNNSVALGTTPTPTIATSTTGGAIATGQTISLIVVALTAQGLANSAVTINGCPVGPVARTNADATVDNIGVGVARKSAAAAVAMGAGATNSVTGTVAPVAGAVGYAWYAGVAGSEKIYALTTIPSVSITSIPTTTQNASALPASDQSQNALVFDGLLTIAMKAGSGAYVVNMPTGVAGTGTPFTSDAAGGIVEITAAFTSFWNNQRLSPDTIWCNAQELVNITNKIVKNAGAPLVRFTQDLTSPHSSITGGVLLDAILNPITQTMVKLRVHPNMPAGTILMTTQTVPYPLPGVGNLFQIKTRREYYQLEWPLRTRKYEYGVYVDEVLQHYFPASLGVINGIGNG